MPVTCTIRLLIMPMSVNVHNKATEQQLRQQCSLLAFAEPHPGETWFANNHLERQPWHALLTRLNARAEKLSSAYISVNSFLQLSWQPLYLSVACVEGLHCVPQLDVMQQQLHTSGSMYGLSAVTYQYVDKCIDKQILRQQCHTQLLTLSQGWQQHIARYAGLSPGLAQRLLSDTLTSALLHAATYCSEAHLHQAHQGWQQLFYPRFRQTIHCSQGQYHSSRMTCCLHYQLKAQEACQNCPIKCKAQQSA
ncbi:hypothetical protein CWC05_12440 [Pseudoalteromonas ruthenica]|uniref:Ferric siderophore reductase C-terminal domain-containing protein n=1 Tax=Pseudoalteromonas ruthenica TaxID=151081 RepID=A0A5S3Z2V4_9GAMM|nr:hypothetical protein CWC05_12440 [Pseudoalteromonas ruthenica]